MVKDCYLATKIYNAKNVTDLYIAHSTKKCPNAVIMFSEDTDLLQTFIANMFFIPS